MKNHAQVSESESMESMKSMSLKGLFRDFLEAIFNAVWFMLVQGGRKPISVVYERSAASTKKELPQFFLNLSGI